MNINFEHFETKPVKLNTVGQFLQHCYEKVNSGNLTNAFLDVRAYINFLDTPLQLGHFVPTDSEGNVLEEPKAFEAVCKNWEAYHPSVTRGCIAYQAAKDAVLFEGWEYVQTGSTFYIQNKNWGIDWYGEKGSIRLFVRTAKSFGKQSNNIIETINDLAEATKDNPIKLKTKVDSRPVKIGEVWQDMRNSDYYGKGKIEVTHENIELIKLDKQHFKYVCEQPHKDGDFSYSCTFNHCRCKN